MGLLFDFFHVKLQSLIVLRLRLLATEENNVQNMSALLF